MRRFFQRADGGIAVMTFTHDDAGLIERDTRMYLEQNVGAVVVGDDLPFSPTNRRFRNCWTHAAGKIGVDMAKARAQRLSEIRQERDAALAATDGPMLRAQEQGLDTKALAAKRQALRDLPVQAQADLAALSTPEELERYEAGL